jgi:glycosyltransferase involved in cell wall biosynthesis
MKLLFWFSVSSILYTYVGYPCLLFVCSRLFPRKVKKAYLSSQPMVSIIIAARNEERNIRTRIENLLRQNYPPEKMEIIIISDGSTDSTTHVVNEYIHGLIPLKRESGSPTIKLFQYKIPRGKPYALNLGVQKASGEKIIFSDARQEFATEAIKELVSNFNDPEVGCVSGELIFFRDPQSVIKKGMSIYCNYE